MTQAKLAAASAVPAAGEGARLWLEASRAVFGGFAASQAELTGFWRERLERWREMTEAVAACRGPDDVLRVHAEYAREMLEAYAAVWLRVVAPVIERPAGAATETRSTEASAEGARSGEIGGARKRGAGAAA